MIAIKCLQYISFLLQAGRSFDLPNPEKFRRRYQQHIQQQQQQQKQKQQQQSSSPNDASCLLFEPETESDIIAGMLGERTSSSGGAGGAGNHLRSMRDDLSMDSCHGNIRYQAVEGLVQNTRPKGTAAQQQDEEVTMFRQGRQNVS